MILKTYTVSKFNFQHFSADFYIYTSFIQRITAVDKIYKQRTQLNKRTNKYKST